MAIFSVLAGGHYLEYAIKCKATALTLTLGPRFPNGLEIQGHASPPGHGMTLYPSDFETLSSWPTHLALGVVVVLAVAHQQQHGLSSLLLTLL